MQTIWVAGGAGFLGSHLCEKLLQNDVQIVCIDNLITGTRENIKHLEKNKNFSFIHQDILSLRKSGLSVPNPDFIFHLASPASPNKKSPRSYMSFPIETLLVNSLGTYNLLEFAKADGARFLYASTSEVYGDPSVSPQPETYFGNVNPNGIRSVYDEGKRFGEALTMAYVRTYHIDARIIRIFNTYGPKMQKDDGRVVSNFIHQALSNEPITIYGDGKQTRSFCYVSDMIEGIVKAMFTENISGEVINIGNDTERMIADFAAIVKNITGSQSPIAYEDVPEDDPKQRCPNIEKAKKLLAWEPKVGLEEGLRMTVEYCKNV